MRPFARSTPPYVRLVAGAILAIGLCGATLAAQRGGFGGRCAEIAFIGNEPVPHNVKYDGKFTFARVKYASANGGYYFCSTAAWTHGYPTAEWHLMKILDFMTNGYLAPHVEDSEILAFDDPQLMKYPIAYTTEVGYLTMSDKEVLALRDYLKKGGTFIVDDFRQGWAWANLEMQMARVFPDLKWIQLTADMPVFHSFFDINNIQFPNAYDQGVPVLMGLFEDNDPKKRLLMIANYNTDISQFWEFSDRGMMPVDQSNEIYKLGVNYLIYALTH